MPEQVFEVPGVSGTGWGVRGMRSGRAGSGGDDGEVTVRAGSGLGSAVAGGADRVRRGGAPAGPVRGLRGRRDVRVRVVRRRGLQGARFKPEALVAPGLLPAPGVPARAGASGQVYGVRREAGGGAVGEARERLHAVVRGAGGGAGAGDAGAGGGPAGGRARHAAVASLEAPCGGGPGRGGLLRGARGGRGRDGVPAGPPLHHAVRGPGAFAASVRDAGAQPFGHAVLPGGPRAARGRSRGRAGAVHGQVGART